MKTSDFLDLVESAFRKEVLKKLVLSRPVEGEVKKISSRLCAHRGKRLLAMEFSLPGDTVSHKNVTEEELSATLSELLLNYSQANLITTLGDAEWKRSKGGKEIILGGDALSKKLSGDTPSFVTSIEELDKKKNYILSGKEDFLIKLGVSSQDGRVHDKKQGKYRQINRFLEHIEEIYDKLPGDGTIHIYDLCCGKSYLSFAVYYYLTVKKGRTVELFGADLKRDVILWCEALAGELSYTGMRFEVGDISKIDYGITPDMVISLHACDIATDIVLDTAIRLGAKVILSTPCCYNNMKSKIKCESLRFVTDHPQLSGKLCEALTDAVRLAKLRTFGYNVTALELTDPENTPKNTLLRAVKHGRAFDNAGAMKEYEDILSFLLGENKDDYLKF